MPRTKVRVRPCNCGHYQVFELEWTQNGEHVRERIGKDKDFPYWNRGFATEALNLLERVYGIPRRSVRFT